MKTIEVDKSEMFAKQTECFPTNSKKDKKNLWLKSMPMYLATLNVCTRVVTPVKVPRLQKVLLMDVITGSLYDRKTKRCLSSDYLSLVSYVKDKNGGKSVLSIKTIDGE